MNLWIRSQAGRLTQIIDIMEPREDEKNEVYNIFGFSATGSFIQLGTYKTKERALEVLNEIKYYKYIASLDWESFVKSVLKTKPTEEQRLILAMMNTYQMPQE